MSVTAETWLHRDMITNGIRMHYVVQGEGPLIVLLHGFPEFWYSWRLQIPFLARLGYKVVAPDLRGYNDSDKPSKGYDVPTLLKDIEGVIQGLGYKKAIIVGHDWGGALAWAFALRYAPMVERLIVLNAPHPLAFVRELRTVQQLRKSWYMFFFQLPWLPEYILGRNRAEVIAKMLFSSALQKSAFPPEVLAHYQAAMSKPGALRSSLNYYRGLLRSTSDLTRLRAQQSQILTPTLLIWGEQDIALGLSLTQGLEEWVPNIKIERIPDSGHWVQQEKAERVNQLLEAFLQA